MPKLALASNRAKTFVLAVAFGATLQGCAVLLPAKSSGGDGAVVQTETSKCTYLDPENRQHLVSACENARTYQVSVNGEAHVYDKASFQETFRERLTQFLRGSGHPGPLSLADASSGDSQAKLVQVEVWLAAPLFRPDEADFVAVVSEERGNFAVHMPLTPAQWRFTVEDLSYLGRASFPSRKAVQAGSLVLTPRRSVPMATLVEVINNSGIMNLHTAGGEPALLAVDSGGAAVRLGTTPFAEPMVARQLLHSAAAQLAIERVSYLPAGEAEGYKARVFSFALSTPR